MSFDIRLKAGLGAFTLDVAFKTPAGLTALFGPSGAGKTSVLNVVAGVQKPEQGRIAIGDAVLYDHAKRLSMPPERRRAGYIFQDGRLFPHMTVRQNLRYGETRAAEAPALSFAQMVDFLGIDALLDRRPTALSGGEAQRVAIGRALLAAPRFLLMDEPLSSLDRPRADEIMGVIERLRDELKLPILYVSHDLAEVERLADHLVLIGRGRVEAAGPLRAMLTDLSLPLAQRADAAAVLDITVTGYDAAYDLTVALAGTHRLLVPGALGPAGTKRRLRVRAQDVSLAVTEPRETSVLNILPLRIAGVEQPGAHQMLVLLGPREGENPAERLIARITRKSWDLLGLAPGVPVFAQIKGMALLEDR